MNPLQTRTVDHWRRALADGRAAAFQRRARFYEDYFQQAEESLKPESPGPFWLIYRMGFKAGYESGCLERDTPRQFHSKRVKKHHASR